MKPVTDFKYCAGCRYCHHWWLDYLVCSDGTHGRCDHPNAYDEIDCVTGKRSRSRELCSSLRSDSHCCGPEAKWFELKEKPWWKFWNNG